MQCYLKRQPEPVLSDDCMNAKSNRKWTRKAKALIIETDQANL